MSNFDLDILEGLNENDFINRLQEMIDIENEPVEEVEEIDSDVEEDDCPVCYKNNEKKNTIIIHTIDGNAICKICGYIKKELIEQCAEWRSGEDNTKSSRCNAITNPLFPKASIGTQIAGRSMLQKIHTWSSMKYRERSLYKVIKNISAKCKKAEIIGKVEKDAQQIYKIISETKHNNGKNKGKYVIVRGTNRKGLIASCVYFACLKNGRTRSINEIAELFDLEYTELNKGCKTFSEMINKRKKNDNEFKNVNYESNYSRAEDFIERYCIKLHIKRTFTEVARKIAKNVEKLKLASNHTPLSIATASILLMIDIHGLSTPKKSIANKFGISTVTLDRSYNEIKKYHAVLLDDQLVDTIVKYNNVKRDTLITDTKLKTFKEEKNSEWREKYESMINKTEKNNEIYKNNNNEFKKLKHIYIKKIIYPNNTQVTHDT